MSQLKTTRPLEPGDDPRCFVGSGACKNEATHSLDDGDGGFVSVCAYHIEEVESFAKRLEVLSVEDVEQFAIDVARRWDQQKSRN
jgi:hypothetical protein